MDARRDTLATANSTANVARAAPDVSPNCSRSPPPTKPAKMPNCPRRLRWATYAVRTDAGTTVAIQAFHAGTPAMPADQYTLAATSSCHTAACPCTAHHARGRKLAAWSSVQATTQPRFVPRLVTAAGVTSWSTAPINSGTVASVPAATGPWPSAIANAGM